MASLVEGHQELVGQGKRSKNVVKSLWKAFLWVSFSDLSLPFMLLDSSRQTLKWEINSVTFKPAFDFWEVPFFGYQHESNRHGIPFSSSTWFRERILFIFLIMQAKTQLRFAGVQCQANMKCASRKSVHQYFAIVWCLMCHIWSTLLLWKVSLRPEEIAPFLMKKANYTQGQQPAWQEKASLLPGDMAPN